MSGLDSGDFWVVSGGFGWFRVGSDDFGWFQVVSGFINYDLKNSVFREGKDELILCTSN